MGLHSLQFGFVGLHFLLFWPFGPSFPFILAFLAFIPFILAFWWLACGAPPPQVAKNGPFAQRPYNGFISAVTGSILQFLALWAFISCILALWAFISLHFGLHFAVFSLVGLFPCQYVMAKNSSDQKTIQTLTPASNAPC